MGAIRIGKLSAELGLPIKTVRRLADNGLIPSTRTSGGHRVFDLDDVRGALATSPPEAAVTPSTRAGWERVVELRGLREDEVWARAATELGIEARSEEGRIAAYAFTEMLNNAIDHSGGTSAHVQIWQSAGGVAFAVADDGEGIFAHLRAGLGLDRDLDAAVELTKGKRTTMRSRHSGEGIFFTSKAVGMLRLTANGLRLTFDNIRADYALGRVRTGLGTVVEGTIPRPPARSLRDVFAEYTDGDGAFTRSRPAVKLARMGVSFVSRSEARRVLDGMGEFSAIDLDFAGVEEVGQGFVDEALRVWPSLHPGVSVKAINTNDAVAFMVRRAGSA